MDLALGDLKYHEVGQVSPHLRTVEVEVSPLSFRDLMTLSRVCKWSSDGWWYTIFRSMCTRTPTMS